MADLQPPGELRMIAYRAAREWAAEHRHQQPDDRMVDAVLAALFEACEVREESRIVIDDPEVTGLWLPAALAGHDERLAANWPSGRVERRFVIETPAEPVVPDNSEKGAGDG